MSGDIFITIKWWLYILLIGILFLPITQKYFHGFFDKGYGFSKVIGILSLSYLSWFLSSLGIFGSERIYSIIIILALIPIALFMYKNPSTLETVKGNCRMMLFEELIFMVLFLLWSYVRGLQPDIYGLEKYMDFGFVNAILRADNMPPIDIWFAGKGINYYYFGHYICAYLTRLTGTAPSAAYNLMLATLFSLSFLLTFSITSNLLHLLRKLSVKKLVIAGLIAASLLAFGGNLHSFIYGYGIIQTEGEEYFYPDSTRYIGYNPSTNDKTIHEFPSYSFIVSDLHGHFSDIPAVLTFIALLLSSFAGGCETGKLGLIKVMWLSFLLSIMYMTNTWDYPIYITVLSITMLYRHIYHHFIPPFNSGAANEMKPANPVLKTLAVVLAVIVLSRIFALPYSLKFESISKGLGLVHYHTPLYQLVILWGYQLFYVLCFAVFLTITTLKKIKTHHKSTSPINIKESLLYKLIINIAVPDMLSLIICCCGAGLLLIPEVIYVSDIYGNGYHRANTMFKLTYQAFIMFCIATGYITVRIPAALHRKSTKVLTAVILVIIYMLPMSYFPLAFKGYYSTLKPSNYKGIDGLRFISTKHPEDYGIIEWLNTNVKEQTTILEAHGDSYSNYGRISMATGLPTVQGWFVHEWLWRNDRTEPEKRGVEVQTVYESQDLDATWNIIRKYDVKYIILGDLEREKFVNLNEDKLLKLGKVVFEIEDTKVIRVK